jgi:hypothetical protein
MLVRVESDLEHVQLMDSRQPGIRTESRDQLAELLAPLTAGPVRLDGNEGPPTRTSSNPTTKKTSDSFGHLPTRP